MLDASTTSGLVEAVMRGFLEQIVEQRHISGACHESDVEPKAKFGGLA